MSGVQQQQKITRHTNGKTYSVKRQSKHKNQTHLGQGVWELSDKEFKTTVINMLSTLMEKVDNMQEHMGNINKKDGRSKKEFFKCYRSNTQ